jgi:hypothetical protein
MILADVALRCTRSGIHKLGHRGDKLCRREWLGQKDAVGNAPRGPLVGMSASHVDDGKLGVDFPGLPRDLPTIHPTSKTDVGDECEIFGLTALQQRDGLFARCSDGRFKTAIAESIFNDALNGQVVFNNQNEKWIFQPRNSPTASPNSSRGTWGFVPAQCPKVYLEDSTQHHTHSVPGH